LLFLKNEGSNIVFSAKTNTKPQLVDTLQRIIEHCQNLQTLIKVSNEKKSKYQAKIAKADVELAAKQKLVAPLQSKLEDDAININAKKPATMTSAELDQWNKLFLEIYALKDKQRKWVNSEKEFSKAIIEFEKQITTFETQLNLTFGLDEKENMSCRQAMKLPSA
jgi:hypothetical protein